MTAVTEAACKPFPFLAQGHVYLCDDAPKADCPKGSSVTFREERLAMMGVAAGGNAAPLSLRALARGEASSPLHRKVGFTHCTQCMFVLRDQLSDQDGTNSQCQQ